MTRLAVSLLGPFQVRREMEPVAGFAYDKVRALLAYLVIESDRPWRRETLASLFWPEQDERAARHSLSQALWSLRRALDTREEDAPLLLVTNTTVQLNPAADLSCDLRRFTELLDACDRHPHRDAVRCRACARRIEEATALYRGDLLEGFTLPDSVLFDEWLLIQREQARERVLLALARLGGYYEGRDAWTQAADCARRLLALDPWREDAVRQLMRLLAWNGQRAAAIDQFARFARRLADELGVEPELETLVLLERIRQGTEAPPATPEPRVRRMTVPEQVTTFVGREPELDALSRLLLDGSRLITLTGPGGIGKTRLAIEAARTTGEAFADGVVFVPLAGVPSASLLASTIGSVLNLSFHRSDDERMSLLHWLRERELLLVLDNAEHLLDGVDLLSEILARAPDVQLLVTSRARLDLHGEWVVEVGGLSLPGATPGAAVSGAEQLFMQRSGQVMAGFAPAPAERAAIAALCRLVEGMPLALEIAAGWLPVLSCAEIVSEITRSLGFLETTQRDVEPRHRSIHAVFDRSWVLLAEQEQRAFRRLAVFRGGFQRDAAEQVAGASLQQLSALVSRSLLRRTSDGRYEMHELLRQYAATRLAQQPDDEAAVRDRHCVYYSDLVRRRSTDLRGARQDEALAELDAEIENLRVACETGIADRRAEVIAESAYGYWLFCEFTGRNREMQAIGQVAIDALDRDDIRRLSPETHALALGRVLILQGSIFIRTGEHEHGEALVARGVELLRGLEAAGDIGLGLNFLAVFAHLREDDNRARQLLRESIDWSAQAGDRWTMAYSLNDLGMAMLGLGDADEARRLQQESLTIFREIDDKRGIAYALHNLGVVARHRGDDGAACILKDALVIRQEIRYGWGIAETLVELGIAAREAGNSREAAGYFRDGLRMAAEIHSAPVALRALTEIAELLARSGDRQRATQLLIDILRHPRADARTRTRASSLTDSTPPNTPIAPAQAESAIDMQVAWFLHHDLPWTTAAAPITVAG